MHFQKLIKFKDCQLLFAVIRNWYTIPYPFRISIRELVTNLYLHGWAKRKTTNRRITKRSEFIMAADCEKREQDQRERELSRVKLCYFSTRFDLRRGGQEAALLASPCLLDIFARFLSHSSSSFDHVWKRITRFSFFNRFSHHSISPLHFLFQVSRWTSSRDFWQSFLDGF